MKIYLLLLNFLIIGNLISQSNCDELKQIDFKEFSQIYTNEGINDYWQFFYKNYKYPNLAREESTEGIINVSIICNHDRDIQYYFDKFIGNGISEELSRV